MSKALELLPIAIFFLLYKCFNIFIATIGLVITTMGLTVLEYVKNRKLSKVTIINVTILLLMSSITIISEDTSFIKMKPALIYLCLGGVLLVDLMILKKFFISKIYQSIFEQKGIVLSMSLLKRLTAHWIIVLFLSAITNEVMWRVFGEDAWVNFKVFVMPLILVLMMLGHVLYVSEYTKRI